MAKKSNILELKAGELIVEDDFYKENSIDGITEVVNLDEVNIEELEGTEEISKDTLKSNELLIDEVDEDEVENTNEETEDNDEETTEQSEDDNIYSTLAETFIEDGLLEVEGLDVTSITSEEALKEVFKKHIDNQIENYKNSIENTEAKELFDYLKQGGKVSDFVQTYSQKDYSTITEEDIAESEDLQIELIRNYYSKLGMDNEFINDQIENLTDYEKLALKAKNHLTELNKKEKEQLLVKTKEQQQLQQQEYNNLVADINNSILEVKEFIPGVQVNEKVKKEVASLYYQTDQKISNNPAKYIPILAYLDYYGLLDGNFDKILPTLKTQSTKEVINVLNKNKSKLNKVGTKYILKKNK